MKVAFDVDDTLIVPSVAVGFGNDVPNYDIIHQFMWHKAQGHHLIIWSGSGVDWATRWAEKLGLEAEIRVKEKSDDVDLSYDDCDVDLAKVNIKVRRINNSVSREVWNKSKQTSIKEREDKMGEPLKTVEDLLAAVYLAGTENGLGRAIADRKEVVHRREAFIKANPLCKEAKFYLYQLMLSLVTTDLPKGVDETCARLIAEKLSEHFNVEGEL